jgi:translation initiation factor 1A
MKPGAKTGQEEPKVVRARLPRDGQVVGLIDQRVGGSRMLIKCSDGKTRNCKTPGRLRRGMWLREGDYVIVEPWEFDDTKGNVMFKYTPAAVNQLKAKGLLDGIESDEI